MSRKKQAPKRDEAASEPAESAPAETPVAPRDAGEGVPEAELRDGGQALGRGGLAGVATTIADAAGPVVSTIADAAAPVVSTIAETAGPMISAARRPVDHLASGARRIIDERSGAHVRRVRRRGREPLQNLWDVHPEARRASIRELGLVTVPVEQIVGTAVEGPPQRGGDFLPLRDRRGDDWRARWQRILLANDRLVTLPPVELIKFGDAYWVVDGHNRVAAALYGGQVALDALVDELRLPGAPSEHSHAAIAPYLADSLELRAAGSGRLTRTTSAWAEQSSRSRSREDVKEGQAGEAGRPPDE